MTMFIRPCMRVSVLTMLSLFRVGRERALVDHKIGKAQIAAMHEPIAACVHGYVLGSGGDEWPSADGRLRVGMSDRR